MTATDALTTFAGLPDVDDGIYTLAVHFQRQDLKELSEKRKGKGKTISDAEAAQDIYASELEAVSGDNGDYKLAKSLQQALDSDDSILQVLKEQERQARQDAEAARVYGETGWLPTVVDSTEALVEAPVSPAISTVATTAPADFVHCYTCVICGDNHPVMRSYLAPCGKDHRYDLTCLDELFNLSSRDETLFPPKCCQHVIPVPEVEGLLDPKVLQTFKAKEPEFSTAGNDRLYCPNKHCAVFVGSLKRCTTVPSSSASTIAPSTRCPACKNGICLTCKGYQHERGYVCRGDQDSDSQEILGIAEANGWKRCPDCATVVELTYGCNHITCRCKYEFCYLCCKKWLTPTGARNCTCVLYTEAQLLRAGEAEVLRAHPNQPAVDPAVAQARLQAAMRHIEAVHDCRHPDGFEFNRVGGECARCNDKLPMFLMDCMRCHVRYCKRCVLNRM